MQSLVLLLLLLWSRSCTCDSAPSFDCGQKTDYCIFGLLNGTQSQDHSLPAEQTLLSVKMKSHKAQNVIAIDCPAGCSRIECLIGLRNVISGSGGKEINLVITVERGEKIVVYAYLNRSSRTEIEIGSKQFGKMGTLVEMSQITVLELQKRTFTVSINATVDKDGTSRTLYLRSVKAESLFRSEQQKSVNSDGKSILLIAVCAVLILLLVVIIAVSFFGIRREVTLRSSTRGTSTK